MRRDMRLVSCSVRGADVSQDTEAVRRKKTTERAQFELVGKGLVVLEDPGLVVLVIWTRPRARARTARPPLCLTLNWSRA